MQLARCRMQQGRSSYRQYCSMSPHLKFNVRVYWTLPSRRIASHEKNRDDTMTLPYAAVAALALMCQLREPERAAGCHSRYRWNIWAVTREATQKNRQTISIH